MSLKLRLIWCSSLFTDVGELKTWGNVNKNLLCSGNGNDGQVPLVCSSEKANVESNIKLRYGPCSLFSSRSTAPVKPFFDPTGRGDQNLVHTNSTPGQLQRYR